MNHWVLVAIDLVNKTISHYDSLHGQDHTCLVRARRAS
jgi:Ulp1 family protease